MECKTRWDLHAPEQTESPELSTPPTVVHGKRLRLEERYLVLCWRQNDEALHAE